MLSGPDIRVRAGRTSACGSDRHACADWTGTRAMAGRAPRAPSAGARVPFGNEDDTTPFGTDQDP
ncbi:hypothetical protein GCM10020256_38320 [Streptomyces thermocoprophilus]